MYSDDFFLKMYLLYSLIKYCHKDANEINAKYITPMLQV